MATTAYRIKQLSVSGVVKFSGLVGVIWGFLAGLTILASYIWGYSTNGDVTLVGTGFIGFGMMLVYGLIGGVIGGAVVASGYNKILGKNHGIALTLEPVK